MSLLSRIAPLALLAVAGCNRTETGAQTQAVRPRPSPSVGTAGDAIDVPMAAQQAGYLTRTYGPAPRIVTADDRTPGIAALFPWGFVGQERGGSARQNQDGSISILGHNGTTNAQLASATSDSAPGRFKGVAFGGGGYFEAVLQFDGWRGQSTNRDNQEGGWPAFWGMAVEHLALTGEDQVPGMPAGYENFIEMDFMEYNIEGLEKNDHVYSGSLINWYGRWGDSCDGQFCTIHNPYSSKIRQLPEDVDFSEYHAYGARWVPATDRSRGSISWYFDGVQIGRSVEWSKLTDLASMPPDRFGIGDRQHLAIMLGTGTQYPMTLRSVSVWQYSSAGNLHQ
jgi:hypothetical protein